MSGRAVARTAFLFVFTLLALIANGVDIADPWHPYSTYGYSADSAGHVTAVDAAAERAGLRVGDQIDVRSLSAARRAVASFAPVAPDGTQLRVHLMSGRDVSLVSHQYSRSLTDNVTDLFSVAALWLYILLAALLVMLRPMPSTWAFYAFSYVFCSALSALLTEYAPLPTLLLFEVLNDLAIAVAPAAFIVFAFRFPDVRPSGGAKVAERALIFIVLPVFVAWTVGSQMLYIANATPAPNWANGVFAASAYLLFGAGIAILLARYVTAPPESRSRLQWVVAGLAVAFVPALVFDTVESDLGLFPPVWMTNVSQIWTILAPLALAYTVLRHRLFDLRFVVSRALVYTIVTSLMIGILALVDWIFGRWLAQSRFAIVGELALALLLGFSLTAVHRRIEAMLNGVIFRAKNLALQALRRFTQEVDLISDPHRLMLQTFDALQKRLESEYAAIYTADGSVFSLATPSGDLVPQLLPSDDFAVLRLRRWSEPFECDEPAHPLRGSLFLPMVVRGQLVGFIVCGPKLDRTHYLPDELETLSALAHRAGTAYAWLTMRPLETPVTLAPKTSA